jgi:hypothetical protein
MDIGVGSNLGSFLPFIIPIITNTTIRVLAAEGKTPAILIKSGNSISPEYSKLSQEKSRIRIHSSTPV